MKKNHEHLHLRYLGIDTYREPVIYMHKDCHICRSEGFVAQTRVEVTLNDRSVIATLNVIESDILLPSEASLSRFAWNYLGAKEGDKIYIKHSKALISLSDIRTKIYGHKLEKGQIQRIVNDIVSGQLSDIQISAFLTATAGHLDQQEILDLTDAMIETGQRLKWHTSLIVDKHCVGGIPGNRTTLIIVPIVAAFGMMIPKTSSRAITSPAGTADTMEVLAPVDLDLKAMRKVVDREGGCIVWGGSVALSPADDILIQIERSLDLDSEGQLVASILSKKIAAGSTHLVIDIPIGPTAKIRSIEAANKLKKLLETTSHRFGLDIETVYSDGSQPIGRGIGPVLEAMDVLAVLQGSQDAPQDLRDHSLTLAGHVLEFSPIVKKGQGKQLAQGILDSGQAWQKFQAICDAQGGMREIPKANYSHTVLAKQTGKVNHIDNRTIARLAKLAGAPKSKAAGVLVHVTLGKNVERHQPLFTIYAESEGELRYALSFLKQISDIVEVRENKNNIISK